MARNPLTIDPEKAKGAIMVRLSAELEIALLHAAVEEDMFVSQLVRRAIREYLTKHYPHLSFGA